MIIDNIDLMHIILVNNNNIDMCWLINAQNKYSSQNNIMVKTIYIDHVIELR